LAVRVAPLKYIIDHRTTTHSTLCTCPWPQTPLYIRMLLSSSNHPQL
jgi:hypothetical protein